MAKRIPNPTTTIEHKTVKPKATRQSTPTAKKKTATTLIWRDVTCRIRHTPNYISQGWTHIEITVVTPKGAPLPITATGYRSHFMDAVALAAAGGPAAFFLDWIEREAKTRQWAKTEFAWRQLELFAR